MLHVPNPQKHEAKPAASYAGWPPLFGVAVPLGLQLSNVMVIRSRAAHRPKQLALSQEVPPPVSRA